ncbi:MAG: holo-ACP synthase [Gammaproteobacteria bacterium]|nr:MAG: holo-[acyl-carrier-protein] synthase [Gammaproteobacteria bacterium]
MIIGIGTDIIQKARVKEIFDKYGNKFIDKVLTQKEKIEFKKRDNRKRKIDFLSNNFASKEAASKVLQTGLKNGITLKNIEVLRGENGAPLLSLKGKAQKKALSLGCKNFFITISDTEEHSIAFVVGES